MPYLTPNTGDGSKVCRRLVVPTEYLHIVTGAILDLLYDWQWEAYGTETVTDAVEAMEVMVQDYLQSGEVCMIGSVQSYITDVMPDGVLECDGSTYNDVDYPSLASVLDATFDNGDGTFTLPDLRGRAIIGVGTGAGLSTRAINDTGGTETHQLTESELPSHNHSHHQHGIDLDVESPAGVPQVVSGYTVAGNTGNAGSDQPHENLPPFVALRWGVIAR